jgi:glycosyltransferase involved in cell wall biosynthesis
MMQAGCTHFHTHFSSAVALLIVKLFPIEYSVTIHGPDEFTDPNGFNLAQKVNAARLVITISSFGFSQALRFSDPQDWHKVVVSRLGVDPSFFDPRPEPVDSPKEILCVARLAPVKAQRILLQAARVLAKEDRKFKLRFVGDGPDRKDLGQLTQELGLTEHVIFDGWLNEEAVRQRYRSAAIFSLASFAEGLPVVLMEAMAMEIPCVAPNIMGIPELIRNGENGLLVPPADHIALARALARLLDDADLRKELGAAGRQSVLSEYDLATNVGDFVAKLTAAVG